MEVKYEKQVVDGLQDLLVNTLNIPTDIAIYVKLIILLSAVFIGYKIIDHYIKKGIDNWLHKLAKRTASKFDDFLIQNRGTYYGGKLITVYLVYYLLPDILSDFPTFSDFILKALIAILGIMFILFIQAILRSVVMVLRSKPNMKDKPVDSIFQAVNIANYLVCGLITFSLVFNRPISGLLTTIGAASAVLGFIFKESISGFVSSIVLSTTDLVRVGDWITVPNSQADGNVLEVGITTVKIQNFDNTIVSVPTGQLLTGTFKNWRGMSESGGRRIKRAILIKANSIKFLTNQEVEDLKKIQFLSNYIDTQVKDIDDYNAKNNIDKNASIINGRNLTNFGLFRKYITEYIDHHPAVSKDLTLMVRQLDPTAHGVPLEIYCFSKDKVWTNYEYIMADIFDHTLAAVNTFGLEVYEHPSSIDVQNLKQ